MHGYVHSLDAKMQENQLANIYFFLNLFAISTLYLKIKVLRVLVCFTILLVFLPLPK